MPQLLTTDHRARHLVSSGNEAGGVALFGGGGLLTSDKGLSWNAQTGTLTVPRLQASEVKSRLGGNTVYFFPRVATVWPCYIIC